jgi:hypothetical protein
MWVVAGLGILASLFAIGIAFVPPSQIQIGSLVFYELFLIIGFLVMLGIPLWIYQCRKPEWIRNEEQ